MELENYTPEVFARNFLEDKKVFGEDTQYIYEEIFSSILGEHVDLTNFVNNVDGILAGFKYNLLEEIESNEAFTEEEKIEASSLLNELATPLDMAKWIKDINPFDEHAKTPNVIDWAKQTGTKGIEKLSSKLAAAGGLKGLFSKLKDKVVSFFGNLKGKSFSEILNNGLAWLQNPTNLATALGTTGGVVLIGLVLKALKKRKRLKEYRRLQALTQKGLMNESFEEELDWENSCVFASAKNKVLKECKTNKILHDALFEKKVIKEENYFNY